MSLKIETEIVTFRAVCGYAPQVGCELEEEKFWTDVDEVMQSIPRDGRVMIVADFNGHVDFAKRMEMAVVNIFFQKRQEQRVIYKSGGRRTQMDYIMCTP